MTLKVEKFEINHKTVLKLMKKLQLLCKVRLKKYKSYKGEGGKIVKNVLGRDFKTDKPYKKLVTDVTEFNI
jgi:putative transposase